MLTLVDLDTLTVVKVEDHGVVPIPKKAANYTTATITDPDNVPYFPDGPRTDVKPFDIIQHDGPSFTVDDHHLELAEVGPADRLHPPRGPGPAPDQLRRPLASSTARACPRCSSPTATPASPTTASWSSTRASTASACSPTRLELGCDCLGEIVYLDGVVNDNDGRPMVLPNAICLHEEDHGIAWKHTDFRTGHAEVRRMRRMVISSIVTVGNYEYGYYWYLYQDGSIEYEVKLSGVISNGAIADGVTPEYGTIVAPGVYGPHHQHFFNVRLDMAVDGTANRVYEVTPTAMPEGPGNPVGNAWRAEETLIEDETMARREADPLAGPLLEDRQRQRHQRARPARRLQARPRAHDQVVRPPRLRRRQAGRLHRPPALGHRLRPGRGLRHRRLPEPVRGRRRPARLRRAGRNLTDTDVVLWFTFGANHVVRPEDWPVMPVHPIGFRLLPAGFFVGNPALDNPQPGGDHCHH